MEPEQHGQAGWKGQTITSRSAGWKLILCTYLAPLAAPASFARLAPSDRRPAPSRPRDRACGLLPSCGRKRASGLRKRERVRELSFRAPSIPMPTIWFRSQDWGLGSARLGRVLLRSSARRLASPRLTWRLHFSGPKSKVGLDVVRLMLIM